MRLCLTANDHSYKTFSPPHDYGVHLVLSDMAISREDALLIARRAVELTCDAIETELDRRDVVEKGLRDQLEVLRESKQELERRVEDSNAHVVRLEEDKQQLKREIGELPIRLDAAISEMNNSLKEARAALFRHINPVQLYCRVRPALPARTSPKKAPQHNLSWVWKDFSIINRTGDSYAFWRVFRPHCTTAEVFNELELMLQAALCGQHIMLITYGETQSGKTHTTIEPNEADPPLLDRFAALAFPQFQLRISFVEVCSDAPHDLLGVEGKNKLVVGNSESSGADVFLYSSTGLYFRYQERGGGYMTPTVCDSAEELRKLRSESIRRRAKHHEKPTSSRGPSWLELRVHDRNDGTLRGIFTIVDLMGAEDSANQLGRHKKEAEKGRQVNNKVSQYLKCLRDQHRVARPSNVAHATPMRRKKAIQERPDNFMRILIPSFEGQILNSLNLPRVAVLAHIYEAADHEKQNQTTMDVMGQWRTNLLGESKKVEIQGACNACEEKARENVLLVQRIEDMEKKTDSAI